jgi:archaellum biogenesis protein FlaJ (TadC family)
MSFQVYIGLMVLASLITGITVLSLSLTLLSFSLALVEALVFAVLAGTAAALTAIGTCYVYPILEISSRGRKIDANLPLIANFMSVLASAGMAALKNAALRSPSKKFASMLDGVVTTSHMGGDLASYLREEADKYKKTRVQTMKGFLETLGTIAETYISFMIALPLALVVMLSVMSFVGGGSLIEGLEPMALLTVLTFVVTPAGVGILLLLVDSVTPPR